jgi:hypothetical protein
MEVWDGSQWQLASSAVNGLLKKTQFRGDGTTTSFAVTDGFDANYGIVFLNGVDVTKDVDISDGQNIKFSTAPANGDEITAYFFGSFRVADVYTKSEIDAGNIVLNAIKNVDGSGSGLDADKLDGLDSTEFHRSWIYSNVNANANVVARDFVKVDTSGGAITLTLPSNPNDNDQIIVWDIKGSFNTNNCTIDGNGNNVMGDTTCILDIDNKKYHIIYDSNSSEWRVS